MQPTKINSKTSQILPSCWHQPTCQYAGHIRIGPDNHWTDWYSDRTEAELELRCLEKRLSYEVIDTIEMEGFYPKRTDIIEEKYQASGRTNGLYTGLNVEDGSLSNNTSN